MIKKFTAISTILVAFLFLFSSLAWAQSITYISNTPIPTNLPRTGGEVVSLTPTPSGPTPTLIPQNLPRTGLPVIAWSLVGLVPVGFGLKKFGNQEKKSTESVQYLWRRRKFLKED